MRYRRVSLVTCATLAVVTLVLTVGVAAGSGRGWTLVGWNNLGMHCMDSNYSLMSILPPYNTVHAQLMSPSGQLVTAPGAITVTYEAVADPDGSENRSSIGKTQFWTYVADLFGVSLPPDSGLAGFNMPGPTNQPQAMAWHAEYGWWMAEGVPITPYDDLGAKNPYPLMRLVARDGAGTILATTEVVLPVSDEMDCRACHASGSSPAAEPAAGWAYDPDPERDYRLNLMRLHDELQASNPLYATALASAGYNSAGLIATAVGGTSVLCARCHGSNALPGTGIAGVKALTAAVHGRHATVTDPLTGTTLNDSTDRSACYRCHPGSTTRCLRGAMGNAVGPDGNREIQCQSCHGSMSLVGAALRAGWLDEPTCQSCHTGTALVNSGQIRFVDAFASPGVYRQAADLTFATSPNVPAAGYSLYRFSRGHGALLCSACHGSTHAIYPSSKRNDNIQNIALQGHKGTLVECATCHGSSPVTVAGGPHGMHPVGQPWVESHGDAGDTLSCRACHGTAYLGTVLSRSQADRVLTTSFGVKTVWRGYQVSCYLCHDGPGSQSQSTNHPPMVNNVSGSAAPGVELTMAVTATDADGNPLVLRIVSQPAGGTAWIVGTVAHYRSDPTYTGSDSFTYAAWDGKADSNLGTGHVNVSGLIFTDGFESGTTVAWSSTVP